VASIRPIPLFGRTPRAEECKPGSGTSWLLDAAGREVIDLRAVANDVSRLGSGVYFMREAGAQAVRKAVISE